MEHRTPQVSQQELKKVRQWADHKIASGSEPPWAWYQYVKLIETIDAILEGMASTTTVNSPQLGKRSEKRLQLVDAKYPRDTARPRRAERTVRMPM